MQALIEHLSYSYTYLWVVSNKIVIFYLERHQTDRYHDENWSYDQHKETVVGSVANTIGKAYMIIKERKILPD